MPRSRRPRPCIHRVDDPFEARTPDYWDFCRADSRTLRVLVWSPLQWERLPEGDRPPGAIRLACSGRMATSPLDDAHPLASHEAGLTDA